MDCTTEQDKRCWLSLRKHPAVAKMDSLACAVTTAFDIKLKRALFSFRIRKTLILTITSVVLDAAPYCPAKTHAHHKHLTYQCAPERATFELAVVDVVFKKS